jgi:hypothetical protein
MDNINTLYMIKMYNKRACYVKQIHIKFAPNPLYTGIIYKKGNVQHL